MLEPMFESATTNSILVTWFLEKSEKELRLFSSSKSFIFGFLIFASVNPANQPAAKSGCSAVNGAAMNAVNALFQCPRATSTPSAERIACVKNQAKNTLKVVSRPLVKNA